MTNIVELFFEEECKEDLTARLGLSSIEEYKNHSYNF